MFQNIKLSILDNIATITFNRPDRLNACSLEMADEISNALDQLGDARVLILTGEGRAFCSGADLQSTGDKSISGGQAAYQSLMQHYNPLMLKLSRLNIPTVSRVRGPAAGIGCSIALAADFVIASEKAYFLQAFVNIGLVPDGGASWMLPRLIGKARATQMMLLGEKIYGAQAAEWGLIYKQVSEEVLDSEVAMLADKLANGPTIAYGIMRQNIASAMENDYASALLREAEGQRHAGDSMDAREGAIAFLKKRKAEFKGQ
ncbi:2-(1,2-epoxy-1,2-dihydrophenyl)acetyl-CoA isomerase [Sphingorhabdus lutea]|uniref:2-(1,2-epoxy-1,2-dihydrophenyl)acetyl-CoA isomerase n=1 Tax=Sphingorhabdus lutea TaxID=1913578 RepID=A0A1L3JEW6_9SPHN|nr:2-(1,2-epoxy-1,2-dihydrophenyl)acetyl-CoA isomerase [Sphingorhabdus lutea]